MEHLINLVQLILISSSLYSLGYLFSIYIQKPFERASENIFYNLVYGFLITVSTYSLLKTLGLSVTSLILLLILAYGLLNRKINKSNVKPKYNLKQLIKIGVPLIIIIYTVQQSFYPSPPVDVSFYSQIAYYHNLGYENIFGVINHLTDLPMPSPYHYLDSWLTAALSTATSKGLPDTFLYLTYPSLILIYLFGLYNFFSKNSLHPVLKISLIFLLITVSPLDFVFFRELFVSGDYIEMGTIIFENVGFFFNTNIFSYYGQKTITSYIIILLYFNAVQDNKKFTPELALSLLIFTHIGFIPALFFGSSLIVLARFIKTKSFAKETLPFAISALIAGLFYILFGETVIESGAESMIYSLDPELNIKGEISRVVNRYLFSFIFLIVVYSSIFILLITRENRALFKSLLIKHKLVFFLIAGGIISRAFFNSFDSGQFLSILLPFLNVFSCLLLIQILENKTSNYILLTVIFFGIHLSSFYNISKSNLSQSKSIAVDTDYESNVLSLLDKNWNQENKISYIISDSLKELNKVKEGYEHFMIPNKFLYEYNYFEHWGLPHSHKSKPANAFNHFKAYASLNDTSNFSLVKFFSDFEISFISCSNKAIIPDEIIPFISQSFHNKVSGESFHVVKISQ